MFEKRFSLNEQNVEEVAVPKKECYVSCWVQLKTWGIQLAVKLHW